MSGTLRFDRALYRDDAVRAAVAAHEGLATFSVTAEADALLVSAEDPAPDLADVLLDSLANHALFETIVRERGAAGLP